MAHKSVEGIRGCGWREAGGIYAVGNGAVVGGTVPNTCRFVRLARPIPFPKGAKSPGRGFIYVDGAAILDNRPHDEWGVSPERADLLNLMWRIWGLDHEDRSQGICAEAEALEDLIDSLLQLEWVEGNETEWAGWMTTLLREIKALRKYYGDCPLVPALMEAHKMRWCGPVRKAPGRTLAHCWRLVTALSWWVDIPKTVLDTISSIMVAIGAEADVPLLAKFYVESAEES